MLDTCIKAVLVLIACCVLSILPAKAMSWIDMNDVMVCTATSDDTGRPDFSSPECRTVNALDIDPQNRLIWVKANIHLDKTVGRSGEPLALFVSGKMSSEAYLNGKLVGRNGKPGKNEENELPGKMDATFYPPQSLFRSGDNELILKASSHHGVLKLTNPVHILAIGASGTITNDLLRRYWPSLPTLGLFILGALYFGITGLIGPTRERALTFCLICIFAGGQLASEVSRGLLAYSYPVHDLRLLAITTCSAGFGLTVSYYVMSRFVENYVNLVIAAIAAASVIGIFLMPGYDTKAELAMLLPLAVCLVATGIWSYQRKPRAFVYFLSLLIFVAAIMAFQSMFLDVVFFYLIAAFLLVLFVEQGFSLAQEAREHEIETARANRLELALEQAQERDIASQVNVKSAGKMERISTDQIGHCKGAGGYTEIMLLGGREILHSASLTELEETLPPTFLRVHRSYLVNTGFVKSLERDPSGTGTLFLTDGSHIPVSRRIMPQVRRALG